MRTSVTRNHRECACKPPAHLTSIGYRGVRSSSRAASTLGTRQECSEPLTVLAGNEGLRDRDKDLVRMRQAHPRLVAHGIGEFHIRPVQARSALPVAYLALAEDPDNHVGTSL